MFRNFIFSAHRNVIRNKVQSIIQVLSLAIGITIFSLITLYLYDEYSVERNNRYFKDIYRVEDHGFNTGGVDVVPVALASYIEGQVPEIKALTRINMQKNIPIAYLEDPDRPGKETTLKAYIHGDSSFYDVFPQEFLLGDPETSMNTPGSIVITESIATRLFGVENPMGKTVYIWNGVIKQVTGVIKDPLNTHLRFEAIVPFSDWFISREKNGRSNSPDDLLWLRSPLYVRLDKNVEPEIVQEKIEIAQFNYLSATRFNPANANPDILLRPLKEVPFAGISPSKDYMREADPNRLRGFLFLGLGILLLAIINYINLASARASLRAREIAIRKISGSSRMKLIMFFLTESTVTTFFAFLASATLIQLVFKKFTDLMQADINLYFLANPVTWIIILFSMILIGILAGLYPAIRLSTASPLAVFAGDAVSSGKSRGDGQGLVFRRILMVAQFTSAVILLIGIQVMHSQLRFMLDQDLGFDSDNVVWMGTAGLSNEVKLQALDIIRRQPEIEFASLHQPPPGVGMLDDVAPVDDPESPFHGMQIYFMYADPEFFKLYDLDIIIGEDIHELYQMASNPGEVLHDANRQFIVNETYWKVLSKTMENTMDLDVFGAPIVGVVEDFHFQSLKHPVKPLIIDTQSAGRGWHLGMKVNSPNVPRALRRIIRETREELGGRADYRHAGLQDRLNFHYVEDSFNLQYAEERRMRTATVIFSLLAVLVAILGLFGLSTFMAQRRTREVGIRKVLGATNNLIFITLARDFITWVTLSAIIGLPLGWFVMDKWREQFAYKADIGIWVYVFTAVLVFAVALATVTWHSLKTSRANPVDALRFE